MNSYVNPSSISMRYRSLLPGLQDTSMNSYVNPRSFKPQIQKFVPRFAGYE